MYTAIQRNMLRKEVLIWYRSPDLDQSIVFGTGQTDVIDVLG